MKCIKSEKGQLVIESRKIQAAICNEIEKSRWWHIAPEDIVETGQRIIDR